MRSLISALILAAGASDAAWADCWATPPDGPPITFTATQAGAPISGSFHEYQGRVCLPEPGEAGSAEFKVATASVDMGVPEFDTEMCGPLWFDCKQWPEATFRADEVVDLGEGSFHVVGKLTLRDVTRPFTTDVRLERTGDGIDASGEFEFSRLDFQVGQGEWSDTRWVGETVTVRLETPLVPSAPRPTGE